MQQAKSGLVDPQKHFVIFLINNVISHVHVNYRKNISHQFIYDKITSYVGLGIHTTIEGSEVEKKIVEWLSLNS